MYTIVRADISPGDQMAQTSHSLADFIIKHPIISWLWNKKSNIMVNLAISNLHALQELAATLKQNKIPFTIFYEPDINQHTSICTTDEAAKILSNLPLALKKRPCSSMAERVPLKHCVAGSIPAMVTNNISNHKK